MSAMCQKGKELHCLTLQLDYDPIITQTKATLVSEWRRKITSFESQESLAKSAFLLQDT